MDQLMNRDLYAGITTGDLIYFSSAVLVGIVLSLAARLVTSRIKSRLRRRSAAASYCSRSSKSSKASST